MTLAETLDHDIINALGQRAEAAAASLTGRWEEIVGDQAARHANPTTFTDATLTITADSAAWATQLRLLTPQIQRNIDSLIGQGVVERINVAGPAGRQRRGGWRVK